MTAISAPPNWIVLRLAIPRRPCQEEVDLQPARPVQGVELPARLLDLGERHIVDVIVRSERINQHFQLRGLEDHHDVGVEGGPDPPMHVGCEGAGQHVLDAELVEQAQRVPKDFF